MATENLNRRDVLAALGGGSIITLTNGAEAVETGVQTRLVEASIEFDIPDGNYLATNIDGNPVYVVDEERDTIALFPTRSEGRDRIISKEAVVAGKSIGQSPTTIGPRGEKSINTDTLGYRRPTRSVQTDSQISIADPKINVRNESAIVTAGDEQFDLRPGDSIEQVLEEQEITVFERSKSEETVSVAGVPDHRESHAIELTPKDVSATPTLQVKNWGKLSVVEITD